MLRVTTFISLSPFLYIMCLECHRKRSKNENKNISLKQYSLSKMSLPEFIYQISFVSWIYPCMASTIIAPVPCCWWFSEIRFLNGCISGRFLFAKKLKDQMISLEMNTCIVITPTRIRFTSKRRTSLVD